MAAKTRAEKAPILRDLKPLDGLKLEHPLALLNAEQLARVRKELDEMARNRREAEASTGSIRLS